MENDLTITLVQIAVVGIGATAIMDAWALGQKAWFRVPSLDYRLVGCEFRLMSPTIPE